jgi:hypothetical protein
MRTRKAWAELGRYLALQSGLISMRSAPTAHKVYITLTTIPDRIGKIRPVLDSLWDQSLRPEKIILNVPAISARFPEPFEIPAFIKNRSYVEVNFSEDVGPATKLLPTLRKFQHEQDVTLIVVDDDQVYPRGLVAHYCRTSPKYPEAVVALCGCEPPNGGKHGERKILHGAGIRIFRPYANAKAPVLVDVVQGASSYCLRPVFFDGQIYDLHESAYHADDIWVSGHLANRQVMKYVVPADFAYARIDAYPTPQSLRKTSNRDNRHNDALYAYFKDHWNKR